MSTEPATKETARWIDNQGDIWTLGSDGLMHTPETAPFPREHVEKKWGPLKPVNDAPAGEHHTGTLNLTGEGNKPSTPISDDLAAKANGIFWNNYGTEQSFVIPDDGTRAMRLALEAAYPAIRQHVAEQIAADLLAEQADPEHRPHPERVAGWNAAAERAREIAKGDPA